MRLPRFQIHLSTLIVLMFLAAGLLYLNVPVYHSPDPEPDSLDELSTVVPDKPYDDPPQQIDYGWPRAWLSNHVDFEANSSWEGNYGGHWVGTPPPMPPRPPWIWSVKYLGLFADLLVALALLFAAAVLLEYPIRRAARKKAQAGQQKLP